MTTGYDNQGGFGGSQGTPSGETKARRNYDEQTLIPVTIKQIITADGDPTGGNDISLKDGRTLYMVKLVGCVRSHEQKSTNLTIQIEDGTGLIDVKTWMNEGDDCSAVANMRQECCQDFTCVRVVGQVKEFDGKRHIQATDIRPVTTKNEITYHLLEVAYSFDKYQKRKESGMGVGMGVGMGYGIGNMTSMPKAMGANVVMNQGGGGNSVSDATIASIRKFGGELEHKLVLLSTSSFSARHAHKNTWLLHLSLENMDSGVNINTIINDLVSQGYSESEVRSTMNHLSNEGHIYSTIDEDHFQYAE
jgi:replication factor A2